MSARINPSILSADFVNFERDFKTISAADLIHLDVMDGHFVPNLTFGLPMVARMQQISKLPLDVHLMIENPERWAVGYAEAGVYSVTFHAETTSDPIAVARDVRAAGSKVGIAVKPGTAIEPYLELLSEFDQILVMTVEPGFGGQKLIESTLEKVARARRRINQEALDVWLQVDGGIDETNIERVAELGADTFVAGSAVFRANDRNAQINRLRELATAGIAHRH
jgi:ribulose-phosphate 3-epimerase